MAKRRRGVQKTRARKANRSSEAQNPSERRASATKKRAGKASSSASHVAAWKVSLLLFGSGACALIYQIAWLREFRLIFGVSTTASAAVLAIFMAGLGAGTFLLGRRVDASPRPLRFYARLEVSIAIFTVATPLLLSLVRTIYISLGGTAALGPFAGTLVRLLLTTLVLAVPTMLMGGSLPAAARALVPASDEHRSRVGLVYGVNTLGSVVGCMLANFVLLELLGTQTTLWVACTANICIGSLAYLIARSLKPIRIESKLPKPEEACDHPRHRDSFVPFAAATVGFVFFLMELVWYRLLGPILGGTVFTFGLVLATALLGIGVGGACYAIFASRSSTLPLRAFGYACMAEAIAIAIPFVLGDQVAMWAAQAFAWGNNGFGTAILGWFLVTSVLVFLPAVAAGMQFPMLIAAMGRGRRAVGKQMGIVYLANTVGAIAGSLAGVFGLMQLLTVRGSWQMSTFILMLLGLAAFFVGSVRSGVITSNRHRVLSWSAALVVVLMMVVPEGPTARWRHGGIGAGRAFDSQFSENDWIRLENYSQDGLVWEIDGVESSVALYNRDGLSFLVNGKSDGNTIHDAPTTVMLGVLPAILHPAPKRALVVGLGTGMTAGWLAQSAPNAEVDIVELEPAILKVAKAAAGLNFKVLENPRVHVHVADAREYLLTSKERYDIVVSEPSNPYRSGVASFFTQEFYRSVSNRLTDDGLFVQWVQGYEVDDLTMSSLQVTLLSVFPNVETWQLSGDDMAFVASSRPITHDIERMRERVSREPISLALSAVMRVEGLEGLLGSYVANADFSREVAKAPLTKLNTDDHNHVEFGYARTLGTPSIFRLVDIRNAAHSLKMNRPVVESSRVDWDRVADAELTLMAFEGTNPQYESYFSVEQMWRFQARQFYLVGNLHEALRAWRQQPERPRGPADLTLVAESLAHAGDDAAKALAVELKEYSEGSLYAITARLAFATGNVQVANEALSAALKSFQESPWVPKELMLRTLQLAGSPQVLPELTFALLAQPFAEFKINRMRRLLRLELAHGMPGTACVEAFAEFEPNVPWQEAVLRKRLSCYERTEHSHLAAIANRDLKAFLGNASK